METNSFTRVPLSLIRENPVALRTVDRESEAYLGLVQSIRAQGNSMSAITLRKQVDNTDPDNPTEFFEICDGLHRVTASKDVGLKDIPAIITDLDDDRVLEAQILANIHKIETKPSEYTQQLIRIIKRNPLMTETELGARIGKSSAWIQQRLNLAQIKDERIKALIDEGKIGLTNAYALAKLPTDFQAEMVDQAITTTPQEFLPIVIKRVNEIRKANKQGRDPHAQEFSPAAYLQKIGAFKQEQQSLEVAKYYLSAKNLKGKEAEAFMEGARTIINWTMHLDERSIAEQKDKYDKRLAEREAKKKEAEAKRAEKKAAEAAEIAANIDIESL